MIINGHYEQGQNANYTSEMTMREMVKVLADVPRNAIIDSMRSSEYYSVMIDETTDISVIKQLIIFGRYVDGNNEVCCLSLRLSQNVLIS